jgi:hypothetical protein
MVVRFGLDIEGTDDFDYSIATTDGKVIADIISDIGSSESSLINEVATKHGLDLTPFTLVSKTEEDVMGSWQDPGILWETAEKLTKVLEKEESYILGKDIAHRRCDIRRLQAYKLSLYDIMKFCRIAQQKNKKVRFMRF